MRENLLFMRKFCLFLLCIFCIGISKELAAANYYVAKTGNDANAGTLAAPKLTIKAATDLASAGDNIYVATGVYAETVRLTKSLQFYVDSVQVNVVNMSTASITLTIDGNTSIKTFNIKDSLVLNNGIVKVGSTLAALRTLAGCILTTGNKSSYVDGRLYCGLTNGAQKFDFPIGKATDYRPVYIQFTKSNGVLTYFWFEMYASKATSPGALPTGIRNYSNNNYYLGGTVPANATNASAFIVTVRYDSISNDDGVYETTTLRLIGYANGASAWTDFGGTGNAVRKGQIASTATGINTLGTFALSNTIVVTATERKTGINVLGSKEPFASYKFTGRCSADSFKFTNLTKSYTAITLWKWNFGDPTSGVNNSSSLKNPVHKFSTSGTFRVSLVVLNADNFFDSWVQMIVIYATPFILHTENKVCIGEQTTLTDFSTANGETITGWNWNLGDGPPATIKTTKVITFTYTKAGINKIYLKVTTVNACSAIDTFDYLVHDKPTAAFTPKDVCFGQSNLFDDQSTVPSPDAIASRKWDLGDGYTSTLKTFSRKYATPGLYNVKLIVYSNYVGQKGACRDSVTLPVRAFSLPLVDYSQSKTCAGEETLFTDNSQVLNPDYALSYFWNFGDAVTDTTMFGARHTYLAAGKYVTRLIVTSNAGCVGTDTLTVFVNPKPSAAYTVVEKCFGDSTAFLRVTQQVASVEPTTAYSWLFDSTLAYFTKNPKVKFAAPGIHKVVMLAKTIHGCRDSAVGMVRSFYIPKPLFALDKTITPNDSIQCFKYNNFKWTFTVGIDVNDTIQNSVWRFGDKKTESPATSNNHSYADTGVYKVKLYGLSIHGCSDSMSQVYVVKPSPTAKFYHTGVCIPDTIQFFDTASKSVRPIVKWKWDFGFSITTSKAPVKQLFTTAGPHAISYIVENDLGCTDTQTQSLTFIQKPKLNFAFVGSMPLCKGDSIDITASGGDTIRWMYNNDTNRTQKLYGKGWYKVRASSGICKSTDSVQVLAFGSANMKVSCSPDTIFRGKSSILLATGLKSYKWVDSSTLNKGSGSKVIAKPLVTKVYYVSGIDSNGCADNDSIKVVVVDPPLLRIPNIITPNDDQQNDFWDLTELSDVSLYDIRISDRQGKLVWSTVNYLNDWKAVDNTGLDLPSGIYFYYMKNRFNNDEVSGYIQVIR